MRPESITRVGDRIEQFIELDSETALYLMATDVRSQSTGKHAKLAIIRGDAALAWDQMNFERHADRVRLANAAFAKLEPLEKKVLTKDVMLHLVNNFCAGLWPAYLNGNSAIMLSGGGKIEPLDYYLYPFIVRDMSNITFGPRGAGKTYKALHQARVLDQGLDGVKQRKVLFVQLERSAYSFGRRIQLVNRALGLDPALPMLTLCARGKSLAEVSDTIRRHVEQDGVEVTFIDSISRTGAGDLKDDRTANSIMDTVNRVCSTSVSLGHLSHAGRNDQGSAHVYGSIHFENAADIVVQLTSQRNGNTLGVGMQIVKANDVGDNAMHYTAFDFDPDIGLIAIRPGSDRDFPDLALGRPQTLSAMARSYLLDVGKADAGEIAEAIGKDRGEVSRTLNKMGGIGRERSGHKVLFFVEAVAV